MSPKSQPCADYYSSLTSVIDLFGDYHHGCKGRIRTFKDPVSKTGDFTIRPLCNVPLQLAFAGLPESLLLNRLCYSQYITTEMAGATGIEPVSDDLEAPRLPVS